MSVSRVSVCGYVSVICQCQVSPVPTTAMYSQPAVSVQVAMLVSV